jgi:hypothetical protein
VPSLEYSEYPSEGTFSPNNQFIYPLSAHKETFP